MKHFIYRMIYWTELYASYLIGFPLRLWLVTRNADRLQESYELRVGPWWSIAMCAWWFTHPAIIDDENCGRNAFRLYFGHWQGVCRLGHQHRSPGLLFSQTVLWWNFRNGKPVFNFVHKGAHQALDELIDQMKNCGFQRREPITQPERQEADPRLAGVTI